MHQDGCGAGSFLRNAHRSLVPDSLALYPGITARCSGAPPWWRARRSVRWASRCVVHLPRSAVPLVRAQVCVLQVSWKSATENGSVVYECKSSYSKAATQSDRSSTAALQRGVNTTTATLSCFLMNPGDTGPTFVTDLYNYTNSQYPTMMWYELFSFGLFFWKEQIEEWQCLPALLRSVQNVRESDNDC